jgi:glycosyltransferase involved in cell wall biosynthesis
LSLIHVIVPGALDQLTGGYLFDKRLVEGIRALGRTVEVNELAGRFPEADTTARQAAAALLARLPDGAAAVIDGLALPAFVECLASERARLKLVGLVHHPLAVETGLDAEDRARLAGVEARLLSRLRGVLCPSAASAWAVENYGVPRDRIFVTPPGTVKPATPPQRPSRREGPLQFLSVGAVIPRKGHALLIEALAALREKPWRLLIVGSVTRDAATVQALERAIARHGLGERVTLAGEWAPERLGAAYAEADVFVLASYHEGYGMAFAEAMAQGLPIVGTTGGAIPETVPAAAALLVPPGDADALSSALGMMLDNGALRARLAQAAAAAGASLPDWPAATRHWLEAFDRLVQ